MSPKKIIFFLSTLILIHWTSYNILFLSVICLLFRQYFPLLANRHLSLLTRDRVYSTCVRRAMLLAAEPWPATVSTLDRLRRKDLAMIRWMCNIKTNDNVCSHLLLSKLGIRDVELVLRKSRMRWFGHVERSVGWI